MRFKSVFALVVAIIALSVQCNRASSAPSDPMDREAIDTLVDYLRVDTSNPPGNETAGANVLQQFLTRNNIPSQLLGKDPKRQSLYARLASGTNEKALVLLHHIDVVPPIVADWTKKPFAGLQTNGYIWARGALDDKSLGIAELMAFVELKRRNVPLKRDVIFLAVADEELGGIHGCKEVLDSYPQLFANAGYVINEGGYNETVVDKVTFWGIETQQKLPLFLRVRAKGYAGHSSSPPDDGGAVAKLVRAMSGVLSIPTPYKLQPEVARYFHDAGRHRPDARGELLRTIAEPLDAARIDRVLTPGYKSLLRDTIALTHINGGVAPNALAAIASCDVDIRLLPGAQPQPMIDRVKSAVAKNADVEVLLSSDPTPESPANTDLFRTIANAMRNAAPGSDVAAIIGGGTSDSRFFRARGIAAYGVAPFKVNYYDADTVHGNDERIRANFFVEGVHLMRRIVGDFCARASS